MIKEIVDWMIKEGTTNTDNGNWIIYYDEIASQFNVSKDFVRQYAEDIRKEVDIRKEILSETWGEEDECFDMNFCLSACKDWDGTDDWGCL